MAVLTDSAPARPFCPFVITGKAGDFPADQAARLALLAAVIQKTGGRANG